MVALGLLLILIALALGSLAVWLAARSTTGVLLEGAGLSVTVLPLTLLACGAAVLVVLWLGWRLIVAGSRRRRAEREELRQLRSRTRETGGGNTAVRQRPAAAPGTGTAPSAPPEPSTSASRGGSAPASQGVPAAGEPTPPDRAVQPRTSAPPSGEGSGSHAGDRPPRS